MTFTVVWMPQALSRLADIWIASPDQAALTAASHRIDQTLSRRPLAVGESRGGADRLLFDPPLWAYYRIVLDDTRIEVIRVGTTN